MGQMPGHGVMWAMPLLQGMDPEAPWAASGPQAVACQPLIYADIEDR